MKFDLRSISVQLLAIVLIVAIVPVVALTYNTYSSSTNQQFASFKDKAGDIGEIGLQSYKLQMAADENALLTIGNDNAFVAALEKADKTALKKIVDGYAAKYPQLDIITVVDENGVALARSATTATGDVTTSEYLKRALKGTSFTSNEILDANTIQTNNLGSKVQATNTQGGLAVVSAEPILDSSGAVIGAVYVAELQNSATEVVDKLAADATSGQAKGVSTIFQGDTRVATSVKDGSGSRSLGTKADSAMSAKVLNGGQIVEDIFPISGSSYYVHYEPIKNLDGQNIGMIGVGYDVGPGLAQLSNTLMVSVGMGVVIAILGCAAGFIVVTRITTPINRLVGIANSVAAGDLETRIETGANGGEIGELTDSTRKMVANIKDRIVYNESILKGITEPLFVVDTSSTITYVNEAGAKLFGTTISDAKGKRFGDFFTVLQSASKESYLQKCLTTGEAYSNFETYVQIRDGRKVYLNGSNAPIKNNSGAVTGVVELLQDITKAKDAEEVIRAAERDAKEKALFSESILKAITDAHFVIDTKGHVTYINEVAQKLLGWSEKEALGRNFDDVIGVPNSRTKQALVEQSNVFNAEGHVVTRDGRKVPVRVNDTLLRDSSGKITGINAMFRDITQEQASKRQLQEITVSANTIAEKVAGASGSVSTAVQQVLTSSRQISESIQQIAGGSQTQARSIDEINHLMHDMSKSIGQVTDGARKTSEDAVKANAEARKGSENAKVAIKKMDELHGAVNDSAKIVQDLGEKSKQIGQIVEMITAIAGQTNLLALNAAIEAARAGEAGRGFAVVAEEVRKLAEESAKAADEINKLIGEVRDQTAKAVESMNKGTHEVEESNKVVAESLKSLEGIGKLIDTTAAKAQEIAAMTEKQAADTEKVAKSVESMAAVIEESASGSEEVSASSEETTSTAEQVAGMAAELAKIADELKAEVGKLKVE